jgi:hypothetical protein
MNKDQLIQTIRQHNRSASKRFLVKFDRRALRDYLQRLQAVKPAEGSAAPPLRTPTDQRAAA